LYNERFALVFINTSLSLTTPVEIEINCLGLVIEENQTERRTNQKARVSAPKNQSALTD